MRPRRATLVRRRHPGGRPVGTVRQAKEALKPAEVRLAQALRGLRSEARNRRTNAAYVRQGEWFFIPAGDQAVEEKLVLRNEPLVRGNGGKPHWAEFCYRTGGETVYVCGRYPNGVTGGEYQRILADNPKAKGWGWRATGATPASVCPGPHQASRPRHDYPARLAPVLMNTENQSKAMRNVAFLD